MIDHSSEISTANPQRTLRGAGWGTRFVVLLFCALFAAAPLLASSEKISQSLKTVDPSSSVNVLIHFKAPPDRRTTPKNPKPRRRVKGLPDQSRRHRREDHRILRRPRQRIRRNRQRCQHRGYQPR